MCYTDQVVKRLFSNCKVKPSDRVAQGTFLILHLNIAILNRLRFVLNAIKMI